MERIGVSVESLPFGHPARGSLNDATSVKWSDLLPGDTVVLVGPGPSQAGVVDAASADGQFLWLILSDGNGRRLFQACDVYRTLRDTEAIKWHTLK